MPADGRKGRRAQRDNDRVNGELHRAPGVGRHFVDQRVQGDGNAPHGEPDDNMDKRQHKVDGMWRVNQIHTNGSGVASSVQATSTGRQP